MIVSLLTVVTGFIVLAAGGVFTNPDGEVLATLENGLTDQDALAAQNALAVSRTVGGALVAAGGVGA